MSLSRSGESMLAWGTGYALLNSKRYTGAKGGFWKETTATLTSMPQAPSISNAEAAAQAESIRRRKASARTSTVKTSPLGIAGEAMVARKTLLGQ